MPSIKKKLVTDENMQPVAVQIDYEDWLEIEEQLKADDPPSADAFEALLNGTKGIWEGEDGLEYQRRIRAEWVRPWDPEAREDT